MDIRALTLVAVVMAALSGCGSDGDKTSSPSNPVIAEIKTGTGPISLTATDDGVWVELHRENRAARIDPETNEQDPALVDVSVHCDLKAANGSVWAAIFDGNMVTRFDGATGEVVQEFPIEGACLIGVDGESVWVTSPSTGMLYRLVEGRDKPAGKFRVGKDPFVVVPADDCLWIASEDEGGVLRRFDRTTHKVTTVGKFPLIDHAVLAFGHLWVSARDEGSVWKLDPSTGRVLDQTRFEVPTGMVGYDDRLWITLQGGVLTSIDPETLEVLSETDLGHAFLGPPIVAFGSLWTSALETNLVLRVDPERIE